MKVLFLDIDGVCNSHMTWGLYGHSSEFSMNGDYRLNPNAVRFIQLLHRAGIKIVLSSTWRKGMSKDKMETIFGFRIFDHTPISLTNGVFRGMEINEWLTLHPEVTDYCIVDDDADMLDFQEPFFVQTLYADGMCYSHMVKICEILGLEFHGLLTDAEKDPPQIFPDHEHNVLQFLDANGLLEPQA